MDASARHRSAGACWPRRSFLLSLTAITLSASQRIRPAILIIALPGDSRDKLARRLSRDLDIPWISLADLRRQDQSVDAVQARMRAMISFRDLQNDQSADALVRQRLNDPDAADGFILDGYPLTESQAHTFDSCLGKLGLTELVVLKIEAPIQQLMHDRKRKGDEYDADLIQRKLDEYEAEVEFVAHYYAADLHRIDGNGKGDDVWQRVKRVLRATASATPSE